MELLLVQFVALFLLALVTGVFWGPWLSLHRSMPVFSGEVFIQLVKTMSQNLAGPMRLLMPACILFMALSTWLYPQPASAGFYFSLTALILNLLALLISILIEVPIVTQIAKWTVSTMPTDWEAIRDRWRFFHVIRLVASLGSFGSFAASILLLIH